MQFITTVRARGARQKFLREKGIEVPDGQRAIELTGWGAPLAIVVPQGQAPPTFLWMDPAVEGQEGLLSDFCRHALPVMQMVKDVGIVQPRGDDAE